MPETNCAEIQLRRRSSGAQSRAGVRFRTVKNTVDAPDECQSKAVGLKHRKKRGLANQRSQWSNGPLLVWRPRYSGLFSV